MITLNMHNPHVAIATEHSGSKFHKPFSSLRVRDIGGNSVSIFLPPFKAAAVAAAFNAAISAATAPTEFMAVDAAE